MSLIVILMVQHDCLEHKEHIINAKWGSLICEYLVILFTT